MESVSYPTKISVVVELSSMFCAPARTRERMRMAHRRAKAMCKSFEGRGRDVAVRKPFHGWSQGTISKYPVTATDNSTSHQL